MWSQLKKVTPLNPPPISALFRLCVSECKVFFLYLGKHKDSDAVIVCLQVQYVHHSQKLDLLDV